MSKPIKITHISAECYPIAKVGGLADVVGALPNYQNNIGHNASVVMPFYNNSFTKKHDFSVVTSFNIELGINDYEVKVLKTAQKDVLSFDIFFIDIQELLFTEFVYSNDDIDRFLAFSIAALSFLKKNGIPDIVHCHDHHTGLVPFMMQECYDFKAFRKTPSILTIHNAQYQGWMPHLHVAKFPEFNFDNVGLLDWNGVINPLAAAIKCAWKVTTVSPSYMEELRNEANGLEALISQEFNKCQGILNGIDTEVWNPETDNYLVRKYSIASATAGKNANKKSLCTEFNLDFEKPLFAFIGRLVGEKGAELLPEVINHFITKEDACFLMLGSGHKETEIVLENLKAHSNKNYNAFIGYDEALSHRIYAGADFLLMPSRVEPCGLNQMYSLRYGTVPVVRNIGGLKDTIVDISEEGFGIVHQETETSQIIEAVGRAIIFYKSKKFKANRNEIMKIDHSWDKSAQEYVTLYKTVLT